jgi:hypothetical protein
MVQCEAWCFKWLAEHELRCARRYQRFFTIVIGMPESEECDSLSVFSRYLRETDEVMAHGEYVAILMAETDRKGAWMALDRLKERFGTALDVRFGVASYPKDGRDVDALLGVAEYRLGET